MSYAKVGEVFGFSGTQVLKAVEFVVKWGLRHRDLRGIVAIGVDEIQVKLGHTYVTLVYQIDTHLKRLLWIGNGRTEAVFQTFFDEFKDFLPTIKFVCSDMWKGYIAAIKERIPQALHILDRFHIMQNLGKAMDKVRREEAAKLKAKGVEPILKGARWCFLKRKENLTKKQGTKLSELLKYNLKSTRAYLLKQQFEKLWSYISPTWAEKFLDQWCAMVMRSKIEPLKKFAKSMRRHKLLILYYFPAKKTCLQVPLRG